MEKIIQIIVENWRIIADVCAALLALVLFICRKKPVKVVDGVKATLFSIIPDVLKYTERKFGKGNGAKKLDAALGFLRDYCAEHFPEVNFDFYSALLVDQIEDILSTPQKKEE